jgi:hypothetical protein
MSAYDRESMIVEFTELAKEGLQTPQPLWMTTPDRRRPAWAEQTKRQWIERGEPLRQAMLDAMRETEIPKKKKPAKKEQAGAEADG